MSEQAEHSSTSHLYALQASFSKAEMHINLEQAGTNPAGRHSGFTCGLVLCRDVEDAVGVDVKDDVDLGHAAGSGGDAAQLELAQQVVVLGARALALVDLDEHAGLVVGVGGEDLLLLGGDGCVARDQDGLQPQTPCLTSECAC